MSPAFQDQRRPFFANISGGSKDCISSVVEPAVPISKRYSPGCTVEGSKISSVEPTESPLTFAPEINVKAHTGKMLWHKARLPACFSDIEYPERLF